MLNPKRKILKTRSMISLVNEVTTFKANVIGVGTPLLRWITSTTVKSKLVQRFV